METEKDDDGPGKWGQKIFVLKEKLPDGAGRRAKSYEHHRETHHKCERGCNQTSSGFFPSPQLLDPDSRKHRDVPRHQGQHARREKRNQSGNKRRKN
jgi:hypothetical protein